MSKTESKKIIPVIIWTVSAVIFLIMIYGPVMTFSSNTDEFSYDLVDILVCMIPAAAVITAVCSLLLILISKISRKAVAVLLGLACAILIALFIQGTFMSSYLPKLDGSEIDWSTLAGHRAPSIVLWLSLVLIGIMIPVLCKSPDKFNNSVKTISILMLLYLLVSLVLTLVTNPKLLQRSNNYYPSTDHIMEMSTDSNFVLLVLDTVDAPTFNEVLDENPEYKEAFSDFTYYENTLGGYSSTARAIPHILSGEWYENKEDFFAYWTRGISESPFLNELKDRGYDIGLYNGDWYIKRIPDIDKLAYNYKASNEMASWTKFLKMQLMLVGLRDAPFDLKKYSFLTPSDIYFDSLKTMEGVNESSIFVIEDNAFFYIIAESQGIVPTDGRCFKYIHTQGGHAPFVHDKDMNVFEKTSYKDEIKASLSTASLFLQRMKESGTYDNSVIVVMADHGAGGIYRQNPILLVKGIGEKHDFAVSDAPVSHEDLNDAFLNLLDGSDGRSAFNIDENENRVRRFFKYDDEEFMTEYLFEGRADDISSAKNNGEYIIYWFREGIDERW